MYRLLKDPYLATPGTDSFWQTLRVQLAYQEGEWDYSTAVLFNFFRYGAPLKMFWWSHAPYLLKYLNSCTLFTDTAPCPSPFATEGLLGAYPPQTKLQPSPNWNMKHYESVEFWLCFLSVKPPTQTQSPCRNAKPHFWKLSGDGSAVSPT